MTIPENQLKIWSASTAKRHAWNTHAAIRNALSRYSWPAHVRYETYLRGSYKNTTNTRGSSDVDIVVQLTSDWQDDAPQNSHYFPIVYSYGLSQDSYSLPEFRNGVLNALRYYFSYRRVKEGRKTLKVEMESPELPADVMVCLQYRKRLATKRNQQSFVEGMTFFDISTSQWVVGYPKLHFKNGKAKEKSTRFWLCLSE